MLVAAGWLLAGCSTISSMNPANWWHRQEGGKIAEDRPPPPGADQPYPKIATVPVKPTPPDAEAMKKLTDSLVADRTNAQHAAESAPLADPSSPTASPNLFGVGTAPPPPPPGATPPAKAASGGTPTKTASGETPVASASMPAVTAPAAPPSPAPRKPVQSAPLEPLPASSAAPASAATPAASSATPASAATPAASSATPASAATPAASSAASASAATPAASSAAPASAATPAASSAASASAATPAAAAAAVPSPVGPPPALPTAPPPRPAAAGPAPAAPVVATPMPTPSAAASATIVFLEKASSLTPPAADEVKAFAAKRGKGTISVVGYGDASSSDPEAQTVAVNLGLSRAQSIVEVLKAAGVPGNAIRVSAEASGRGASLQVLQ